MQNDNHKLEEIIVGALAAIICISSVLWIPALIYLLSVLGK